MGESDRVDRNWTNWTTFANVSVDVNLLQTLSYIIFYQGRLLVPLCRTALRNFVARPRFSNAIY